MKSILSRWLMFGLLFGWAMTHATVFGQGAGKAGTEAPVEKIRQALDKNITVDFVGQTLNEALNHFRDKTGLALNLDQTALMMMGMNGDVPMMPVEMKAKNEKAGAVLRKVLTAYRLSYVVYEGSLLITSDEMAVMRQMRQRVSVSVDEVPLKKAASELAKNHGVNLVIDRAVGKEFVEAPVSLQVENTGIETALRLLAEQGGLKAVRMGNVMYITTAGKAKTIREEESHQLDSPLNPNMPGYVPMPAVGGFAGRLGGGFGGIAMPAQVVPALPVGEPPVPPRADLPVPVPAEKARPDGTVPPQRPIPRNSTPPAPVPPPAADRPAVPAPVFPGRQD